MLWNFMMHALMGWLGPNYFLLTPEGIGMAILVVCVTQAVDQIRIRKEKWKEINALPTKEHKAAKQKMETDFNKIMALVKSIFIIGIYDNNRKHYWHLFFWTIFKHPKLFPMAITYSIYGYHFKRVFKKLS